MTNIELPTTQNVIIRYEIAGVVARVVAFVIDFLIIAISCSILIALSESVIRNSEIRYWFYILFLFPIYTFYTLGSEITLKGQTLGKKAMGIRRVHLNGKIPDLSDYALAWSTRLFDIWATLGSMAVLFVISSEKGQRLGDRLSNTIVIKAKTENKAMLSEILKMKGAEESKIMYPQVIQFTEEQMLFLKKCLLRVQKKPNDTNKAIIRDLAMKLSSELGLEKTPTPTQKFLSQLIKDYVVLTR